MKKKSGDANNHNMIKTSFKEQETFKNQISDLRLKQKLVEEQMDKSFGKKKIFLKNKIHKLRDKEKEKRKKELIRKREKELIRKREKQIDTKIAFEQIKDVEKRLETEKIKKTKLDNLIASYAKDLDLLKKEVSKVVVGHNEVLESIIRGFLAKGHVLVEGVPGIAKTLLIRTIAVVSGCDFSRIQFTVDLLPTDITGVTMYNEVKKQFFAIKGPIFSNFLIADEINRAPPKSQSAMLEAMQEKQVTIGKETHHLPNPFFVMANNNPLESSGTYPLPEAQIDRFLFKIKMGYTSEKDEKKIIDQNISINPFNSFDLKPIISPKKILKMQEMTKKIFVSDEIKKYIVRLVVATRDPKKYGIKLGNYLEWGCSPRASIGLSIAARADALLKGKSYVTPQNIKNVAHEVLRHRFIFNYLGQVEKIDPDKIVDEILQKVPMP